MSEGLQVIGAGYGRTGTLSLKVALEQIGFGPCYHMMELLKDPSRVGQWMNAQRGRPVDWDALLAGYGSAVDFPTCLHFERLIEVYPQAKVVLTVRDTESWYASASQTIMSLRPTARQMVSLTLRLAFSTRARGLARVGRHNGKMMRRIGRGEEAKRGYEEHIARVREVVPPERLLEFSVKQGWEPLCEFLGVNVPGEEFPRVNERAGFREWALPLLE